MSTERYDYPEDEFDVAGRDRGPQGAHRTPRPLWRSALPFLVVLVAAPLLAWGLVTLIGGGGGDDPTPQATEETTSEPETTAEEPTDEATEDGATDATEEPDEEATEQETEEPAGDVDQAAVITVLNGAGVSGLAGQAAQTLTAEGFAQVSAANYGAAAPETTTLYYNNADLAPTAEAVGQALGIGNLVEAPSATQNVDIAIVLRADYTG